jgi:hypothetical protein
MANGPIHQWVGLFFCGSATPVRMMRRFARQLDAQIEHELASVFEPCERLISNQKVRLKPLTDSDFAKAVS